MFEVCICKLNDKYYIHMYVLCQYIHIILKEF